MKPETWLEQRLLVTVGTGGVGKTTVAAALGLEAARRGKKALVLTIDPARRLAEALGLDGIDQAPRKVPIGAGNGGGALYAMMLDTKRTFDELLERLTEDTELRERIHANAIYRNLTDALSGSREYSAMEKLYQLARRDEYDLIVLDTPPAAHALEFLDAPRRLTGFLESRFLRGLLAPGRGLGRAGFRLLRGGSQIVTGVLERIAGLDFLRAFVEFLLAFESLVDGFATRAREVGALLRGPDCGFVLVCGPEPPQVERARAFLERLERERIRLVGLVVNRLRSGPETDSTSEPERTWLEQRLARADAEIDAKAAAAALIEHARRRSALARRDARMGARLVEAARLEAEDVGRIPLLAADVHELGGLGRMAGHVFGRPEN